MICCDIQLGPCGICHTDSIVHIDKRNPGDPGFGCLNCGTAEKKGDDYVRKDSKKTA